MLTIPDNFEPRPWRYFAWAAMPLYLLWTHFMMGLRIEHWIICGLFVGLFSAGRRAAWFAYIVLPFLAVGVGYDNLRLFMHLRPEIHVGDLYNAELALFGIDTAAGEVIPPLFFKTHNHPALDVITGLTYLLYLLQTFAFGAWLIFRDDRRVFFVTWGFFLLNVAGWTTWILWPAAPPWYADQYGLGPANMDALPSAAGAARFDAVFGISLFHDFYSRNANVFGAMPSLHCAYPTLVALIAWGRGHRGLRLGTWAFAFVMYFSAVYLQHHYVLDVIAGITYSIATYACMLAFARWRATARDPAAESTAPAGG